MTRGNSVLRTLGIVFISLILNAVAALGIWASNPLREVDLEVVSVNGSNDGIAAICPEVQWQKLADATLNILRSVEG